MTTAEHLLAELYRIGAHVVVINGHLALFGEGDGPSSALLEAVRRHERDLIILVQRTPPLAA